MKLEGKAKMLRIHFGEYDKWNGKPLYRDIVDKCRALDLAVATAFRGIEGYGASSLIHRSHLLSFSSNAPITVSVIDSEENIQKLLPFLDEMVDEGLIAMSEVEVIKYVHQEGWTLGIRSVYLPVLSVLFAAGASSENAEVVRSR